MDVSLREQRYRAETFRAQARLIDALGVRTVRAFAPMVLASVSEALLRGGGSSRRGVCLESLLPLTALCSKLGEEFRPQAAALLPSLLLLPLSAELAAALAALAAATPSLSSLVRARLLDLASEPLSGLPWQAATAADTESASPTPAGSASLHAAAAAAGAAPPHLPATPVEVDVSATCPRRVP